MEINHLNHEKKFIKNRFAKALSSYNDNAVVQQRIHYKLIELLQLTGKTSFDRVLEIGCGTGGFTQQLTSICSANEWIVNDLFDDCIQNVSDCFFDKSWQYLPGDAEQLTFPGTFDMVTSASCIQWFNSPRLFVQRMAAQLTDGAVLLLNTYGQNNLFEISTITGKGLTYVSLEYVKDWVNPHFDILCLQEEEIKLKFPNPMKVLHHLKSTGVTGTNTDLWTKKMLQNFCDEYVDRYSVNSDVILTYHPVYLLAIKQ
jgi:malonyl-CoA O-methyltransferase